MDVVTAIPAKSKGPALTRVGAGIALLLAGLGLVVLGGCFLIGAMVLVRPELLNPGAATPAGLAPEGASLLVVLYVVAAVCLLGAVVVIGLAVGGLLRLLLEKPTASAE